MYPAQFDYRRAGSVDEALSLLQEHEEAKLMAGGHSLIPMMKLRLAQPPVVIDIGRLGELQSISEDAGTVRVGALTTHAEIAASSVLAEHCPALAEAAGHVGDVQVRNRGTIGGNIAHADPGSDLPPVLVLLGATVHLQSAAGTRSVAAADFFQDLLMTDVGEDEILTHVEFPAQGAGTGSAYLKFEHPASGYAVVGAAASVTVSGGSCTAASLVVGGAFATPVAVDVSSLVGSDLSDDALAEAAANLDGEDPMGDIFASGDYRVHVGKVYGKRALAAARDRASQG